MECQEIRDWRGIASLPIGGVDPEGRRSFHCSTKLLDGFDEGFGLSEFRSIVVPLSE